MRFIGVLLLVCWGCDSGSDGDAGPPDGSTLDGGLDAGADAGPDGALPDTGPDPDTGMPDPDTGMPDPDAAQPDAAEEPDPRLEDPTTAGITRLAGQSARPLEISGRWGLPRVVLLDVPAPGASQEPVAAALRFLNENNDIWRIGDAAEGLYLQKDVPHGDGGRSLVFGQRIDNVPVHLAQIIVDVKDERIRSVQGGWTPDPVGGEQPPITAELAEEKARMQGAREVTGQARAIWYDPTLLGLKGPVVRAWRVLAAERNAWFGVIVDANSGEVLLDEALNQDVVPDVGEIFNAANATAQGCWFFNPPSKVWRLNRLAAFNPADPDQIFAETAVPLTLEWYLDQVGRRGWDGLGSMLGFYVHNDVAWNNAHWVPVCNQIEFGDARITTDIVAHELTHGVVQATAALVYLGEPGALNESYADIMAFAITGDELLGEGSGFGTACAGAPAGAIRSMQDPPRCGQPDHMRAAMSGSGGGFVPIDLLDGDNGAVHTNSGIQNKAAFLIARGGNHGGLNIRPLGDRAMAQLFYRTLSRRLSIFCLLQDSANLVVDEAVRMQSEGLLPAEGACQVRNAFASVGLASADSDCDGTLDANEADSDNDGTRDSADNCPRFANPGQADLDGDALGDPCDPDADGDGVRNLRDVCPRVVDAAQMDTDGNGTGDACQDSDRDNVSDLLDNCPMFSNTSQADLDGDRIGNAGDPDRDEDGVLNQNDTCPDVGDAGNMDGDGDGDGERCDNCRFDPNPDQRDTDRDGRGDVCDNDRDGDGEDNALDPCPTDNRYTSQHFINGFRDDDQDGEPFECDADEQAALDRVLDQLRGRLHVINRTVLRLPIPICGGGCPDVLGPDARVRFLMDATEGTGFRVVDDSGQVLGTPTEGPRFQHGNLQTIEIQVPADVHYRAPIEGENRTTFQGRALFLELLPPEGLVGQDLFFEMQAQTEGF